MTGSRQRVEALRQRLFEYARDHEGVSVTESRQTFWADDDTAAWATIAVYVRGYDTPTIVVEPRPPPLGDERWTRLWLRIGAVEVWLVGDDGAVAVHTRDAPEVAAKQSAVLPELPL